MKGVDFRASLNNLTQLDRHQQDIHKAPLLNQERNSEIARQKAAQRVEMPVQPDETEGKNIDPEERRREQAEGERKKRRKNKNTNEHKRPRNNGLFVDIDA
ncbi:MAG: hypothetical protein GF401_10520 [Chitinivibrionales bacterium]|nr:hypothetical protein [Chitinivibrionales bacterium]